MFFELRAGALFFFWCFVASGCAQGARDDLCAHIELGDVVITEIMANPEGADTGLEYIELYNSTDHDLDLSLLDLRLHDEDGSSTHDHRIFNLQIASHSYLALGDASAENQPDYIDYTYESDLGALRNVGGRITLNCAEQTIASATYAQAESGKAWQASDRDILNGATPNFDVQMCLATMPFSLNNYGTPGMPNEICPIELEPGECRDGIMDREIHRPVAEDLVISEWMADPQQVTDSKGEWFEIRATVDVDLNGLVLSNAGSSATLELHNENCLKLAAGEFLIFAKSTDSALNGGIDNVYSTFPFSLTNDGGTLQLFTQDQLIEEKIYSDVAAGKATQIDDANIQCEATTTYGAGDYGTPGAENPPCA